MLAVDDKDAPPSPPDAVLSVAISGAGPAGLAVAMGLARLGHSVTVFEKSPNPRGAGISTVNRDRSYPVDITARGMLALDALDAVPENGALRARLHRFLGHSLWTGDRSVRMPIGTEGLIGTRDDIVCAMLEHIEDRKSHYQGRVEFVFDTAVLSVDLDSRTLVTTAAGGVGDEFDLVCACDGKNSAVRDSCAGQDPDLVATFRGGRDGEVLYKTFNLDRCDEPLDEGWLFMVGGPPPHGAIVSRVPGAGGAIGILPLAHENPPPDVLQQKLPADIRAFITPEEENAWDRRPVSNAGGGFTCSQLTAGSWVAIVGDAATSPPPPGQGINHALEAAVVLVNAIAGAGEGGVTSALAAYNEQQHPDEEAFAFLGAQKTRWQEIACLVGGFFGLHPRGPNLKDRTCKYREVTSMHKWL